MGIRKRQLAGLAAILIATGGLLTVHRPSERGSSFVIKPAKATARKIYPYSVIRGGVVSALELRSALSNDRIAALHYADFQIGRARVERLDRAKKVFVSYRIGDRIYWTQKRVALPKGEQVLSDGTSIARTRCGNRISDLPQSPVNPAREPSEKVLDQATASSWEASTTAESESGSDAAPAMGKVEGGISPTGDYLSSFGPKAVASIGERAFGGGQMNSAGNSAGGLGSASGPERGESASNSPSSLNPTSVGTVNLGSAISAPVVLNPQASPTSPSFSTAHIPVFVEPIQSVGRSGSQATSQTSQATEWNLYPAGTQDAPAISAAISAAAFPDGSDHSGVLGTVTHSFAEAAIIPHQPLIKEVQTPEPKPLLLVLCGAILIFSGFLIRRRARLP